MKIFIVEDSPQKLEEILKFLQRFSNEPQIRHFGSYQSGLSSIIIENPDIAILDMTIPTFDRKPNQREGRFRPLGGYDIIRKLRLKGIQTKVIILSQLETFGEGKEQVSFEQITSKCHIEFPEHFVESIKYKHKNDRWKSELTRALTKVGAL